MATTFVKIGSTISVGVLGAANMEWTSIPSTYTDLAIKISARTNRASIGDYLLIAFNGSTSSFTNRILDGNGATASVDTTARAVVIASGATSTSATFGSIDLYIPNYTASNYKVISNEGVSENNATTAFADLNGSIWASTAAINQITLTPNAGTLFSQYTTATLYGISKS
jgi:hypothetical protein